MSNFPVHLIEGDIGAYIHRLMTERDAAYAKGFKEAIKADDTMIGRIAKDAEKRGYLKGLSDAQLAIQHADVLWAHSRAIDALKAKVQK